MTINQPSAQQWQKAPRWLIRHAIFGALGTIESEPVTIEDVYSRLKVTNIAGRMVVRDEIENMLARNQIVAIKPDAVPDRKSSLVHFKVME